MKKNLSQMRHYTWKNIIIHLDLQCSGYLRELILQYNFKYTRINTSKNKTPAKYSIKRRDSSEICLKA